MQVFIAQYLGGTKKKKLYFFAELWFEKVSPR